ncbi:hypothetical protein CI807_22365 [Pseudomonas sp. NS1(2017)]|jgi:major type 1 subunit fimbrin (pilin)|uniref:fimbrial protein n=1 Tax=Pseudomonas sp. NS1(2017) TaxID=2025658 RepID=UPI000BA1EE13|nr:fimbrial protein [Pseudomonas sp. NS1(2017)]ASV38834.1 hypothetical protein CI807_22365 [Pseudomonas sp. NS1(2017)]
MKKNLGSLVFALFASALAANSAIASDGTITINGSVTGNTCNVTGNSAGGNITVNLDRTGTNTLNSAGQTAGFKPFSIRLSDCTASGIVKAGFEAGATTDIATGRLKVLATADAASNVDLQLRNPDNSVIKIGDSSTIQGITIESGAATLDYLVGYYATGAATPGTANSTVTYSIIYP